MDSTHPATLGPIAQLRAATRNPGALALGALLGGFVPVASALTAHYGRLLVYAADGLHVGTWADPRWIVVVGGLGFSAKSVYQWTWTAFRRDRFKAAGFVALLECTLLLAPLPELQCAAAAYLILINMLSAGDALASQDREDVRAVATPEPPQATVVRQLTQAPVAPEVPSAPRLPAPVETEPTEPTDDALYAAALEHVRQGGAPSVRALRDALGCSQRKAMELARQLRPVAPNDALVTE